MLTIMRKGITLTEAVRVIAALNKAGIMVHIYLIYGFPGQDTAETIGGLEIVRQLFEVGLIQSVYYHRFALTVHSPVFAEQQHFGIHAMRRKNPFATNNLSYREKYPSGATHWDMVSIKPLTTTCTKTCAMPISLLLRPPGSTPTCQEGLRETPLPNGDFQKVTRELLLPPRTVWCRDFCGERQWKRGMFLFRR